jgi:CBS domain-containing protein
MKIKDCMKRNVYSLPTSATVAEAALVFVERHVGTLPVMQDARPVGILGLRDLLSLEMPDFLNLVADVDFVHDFGAVETTRPASEQLAQPVTTLMRPIVTVQEDDGLLRTYAMMLQNNMHDLPVLDANGNLAGIVSRVDIGTAILSIWPRE